jgi:HK97 gp10 family phage protein
MAAGAGWIVVFNRIPQIVAAVEARARTAPYEVAQEVAQVASANAPVDTGELRDSIVAVKVNQYNAEVRVGAEHGIYVEYGTYKMPAQPYFAPACEGRAEEMLALFAGALGA